MYIRGRNDVIEINRAFFEINRYIFDVKVLFCVTNFYEFDFLCVGFNLNKIFFELRC